MCHGFYAVQLVMHPSNIRLIGCYVNEVRVCLRTAATKRLIVHHQGYMRAWRAMVMMMLAGKNS